MSREVEIGADVIDQFPVWSGNGYDKKSGETVFDVTIWKDGERKNLFPYLIEEIDASGEYRWQFRPDDVGFWVFEVKIPYNQDVWAGEYRVTAARLKVRASMSDDNTTTRILLWVEVNGKRRTDWTKVEAIIRDEDGTQVVDLGENVTPNAEGVYEFETPSTNLDFHRAYTVDVKATRGTTEWDANVGFARI